MKKSNEEKDIIFTKNNSIIEKGNDNPNKIKEDSQENICKESNINIINSDKKEEESYNIKKDKGENVDYYDYRALYDNSILGRFSLHEKICIINKLNIIVYSKIKKELIIELNKKRFENKILLIKSRYKTDLILTKKLHSLVQEKMLRDFNFKKNLKDLRKKLMDEKIEKLKYKNLVFIMKAYGIFTGDQNVR